ncbi:MAG: DUF1992 domain-containing protein [Desulfobulbaceae bacterium]|nr:DUF1992 domain-containing protein [Desulfobulbaceae bacterium]
MKNAGYVPEEVALRKEIFTTEDLLAHCRDEKEKLKQLKKLSLLISKLESRMGRSFRLDSQAPYFEKVVDKVQVNNR